MCEFLKIQRPISPIDGSKQNDGRQLLNVPHNNSDFSNQLLQSEVSVPLKDFDYLNILPLSVVFKNFLHQVLVDQGDTLLEIRMKTSIIPDCL